MQAYYGYADGSGDYFIVIDTDKCNSCGECVSACPSHLFATATDDYGKLVALVPEGLTKKIGYLCPGLERCSKQVKSPCQSVCREQAIRLTW
ncbi:MAG: 4Fe-4S binding protein [Dehalococcoidia bacterium]